MKINSIKELIELASVADSFDDGFECYIRLNFGAKSSKSIKYFNGNFHIIHEIDNSSEIMTENDIIDSNIGLAISRGALISY